MSRIITQTDIVIEIIKSPSELIELANSLLKLAYSNECTGIALNLGLGFYGAIEQSYQIRFINEDLLETDEDEDDEQEYADDEEDVEQELETETDDEDANSVTDALLSLFTDMGFIITGYSEDDAEIDESSGVVIPASESELVSTEAPADTTDYSDVSHLYSGQV
jgi:hypothetical protein